MRSNTASNNDSSRHSNRRTEMCRRSARKNKKWASCSIRNAHKLKHDGIQSAHGPLMTLDHAIDKCIDMHSGDINHAMQTILACTENKKCEQTQEQIQAGRYTQQKQNKNTNRNILPVQRIKNCLHAHSHLQMRATRKCRTTHTAAHTEEQHKWRQARPYKNASRHKNYFRPIKSQDLF